MENKKNILEPIEKSITLEMSVAIDPKEFFKTREGLYVWSSFQDRILEKAKIVKANTKFIVASAKLAVYATDDEIEKALPKKHIFKESDVCAIIAELVGKQSKGEEGTLINNGYANLFYTKNFVVSVRWRGSGWFVDAWRRGGFCWGVDGRVFSPAN